MKTTRFALLVSLLALAACQPIKPQETKATSNPSAKVDLLFTHEGVRVYRFRDSGEFHYYAVGGRLPAETFSQWDESCGKNCTRTVLDEVQTLAGGPR